MEYVTTVAVIGWMTLSCGTAITAAFAVDAMGRMVGIRSGGECGGVVSIATNRVKSTNLTVFETCVESTIFFPIVTVLGPFAIPVSITYIALSLVGLILQF